MSFPSFISQNPYEITIFGTFFAKFSMLAYVLLKVGYFEVWTCSLLRDTFDVCTRFGIYKWKDQTYYNYTIASIDVSGVSIFKFTGGGNQPLW